MNNYIVCLINNSSGTVHSYIELCGGYTPTTMLDADFAFDKEIEYR